MLETIIGSSVVAALITAIVTGLFKWIDRGRDGEIRREEREESRKDRAVEIDLEDRRARASAEAGRLKERKAEGRSQALVLLDNLEKLDAYFESEDPPLAYQTYSSKRELSRPIRNTTRLIPDPEFREYIDLSMQVVAELWVPARTADGPEYPGAVQRQILGRAIDQVGRFVTDDGWDRSLVAELRSSKDMIDEYWEYYER